MVPSAYRFGEAGGAFRLQPSEEHGSLYLRRGDGSGEVDGVQRPTADRDRSVSIHKFKFSSHLGERLMDALHGTESKGVVANECKGVGVRCDEPRQHPHGRPGVAAIKSGGWLTEGPGTSGDLDGRRRPRTFA